MKSEIFIFLFYYEIKEEFEFHIASDKYMSQVSSTIAFDFWKVKDINYIHWVKRENAETVT